MRFLVLRKRDINFVVVVVIQQKKQANRRSNTILLLLFLQTDKIIETMLLTIKRTVIMQYMKNVFKAHKSILLNFCELVNLHSNVSYTIKIHFSVSKIFGEM